MPLAPDLLHDSAPTVDVAARDDGGPRLVPSVQKAVAVLNRLAAQREPMALARLTSELALPKSSVHALCGTLQQLGYLHRQPDGAYRLGPRVMALAHAFMATTGIAQAFDELWQAPAVPPEDTVVLSVLDGPEVVYIGARNGRWPLGLAFTIGMRLPAHETATGLSMLAHLPLERLQALYEHTPRGTAGDATAPTQDAGVDLPALVRCLQATRARGHGIDDEVTRRGVYCVAAPVFDATGQACAGVGMCLLKSTLDAPTLARHVANVQSLAERLTRLIGGEGPTPAHDAAPSSPEAEEPRP